MAIGRPDYSQGVVPVAGGYSSVQTPYFDIDGARPAPLAVSELCEYTVAAGYELHITGYRVSAQYPGEHLTTIYKDAGALMATRFDKNLADNLPAGCALIIDPGETVKLTFTNNGPMTSYVTAVMYGFLEQITA